MFKKDDQGKTRFSLLPPSVLEAIARVLTYGAEKYGANNWCNDALDRHWIAWKAGEDYDEESEHHHLAHVGCCLMFLLAYHIHDLGTDDRINHTLRAVADKRSR